MVKLLAVDCMYIHLPGCISDGVVELVVGHWTCDSLIADLSRVWALLCSGLGQATYICVPLSRAV